MKLALVMAMINMQSSGRTQSQFEVYIEQTQAENISWQKGHEAIVDPLPIQKTTTNRIEDRICGNNVYGLPSYSTAVTRITAGIQIRQSNRTVCLRRCQCSCNRPGQFQSPRSLSDLIGSLFVGYTSIPWLGSSCDNRSHAHLCRNFLCGSGDSYHPGLGLE